MTEKYPIFNVSLEDRRIEEDEIEPGGYLTKFWVNHKSLGRSLVKLEELTAPAWSEKIVFEIAKMLSLPAARYELGVMGDRQQNIVISPDYKDSQLNYITGDRLIKSSVARYQYNVSNSIKALEDNKVGLPAGYTAPQGIRNGTDLFVGYLMLDALVTNDDRHGGNWEVGIDSLGTKTLAPLFDNGASFGCDYGSSVYDRLSASEYSQTIISMLGVTPTEAWEQARLINPQAAAIWLDQLNKIEQDEFTNVFERIPETRIDFKAKQFASALLDYNRQQLAYLHQQQKRVENIGPIIFNYLRLKQNREVESDTSIIQFDPQSKILSYQDRKNSQEYLQARLAEGKWFNLKSNISEEKERYLVNEIAPEITWQLKERQNRKRQR